MVQIPLDTVDAILSELDHTFYQTPYGEQDDFEPLEADLVACTLVCRAWKPLVTSHLFRHIGYSFSYCLTDIDAPVTPCRWSHFYSTEWLLYKTLDQLYTFFVANPAIRISIRELYLRGFPTGDDVGCTVKSELLTSLINIVPNLRTLHLVDVACSHTVSSPALPVDFTLESLVIEYPLPVNLLKRHYTQLDCVQLLVYFGASEILALDITPPEQMEIPVLAEFDSKARLRVRMLKYIDEYQSLEHKLLQYLATCSELCCSIRKLVLLDAWKPDVESLSVLLRSMGPTLEDLVLLARWDPSRRRASVLDLSPCKALKSFVTGVVAFTITAPEILDALDSIIPLFAECGITRLQQPFFNSISIRVLFLGSNPIVTEDRESNSDSTASLLDGTLVEFVERLGIERVSFEYIVARPGPTIAEDLRKILEHVLPKLLEKGYLRLVHHPL